MQEIHFLTIDCLLFMVNSQIAYKITPFISNKCVKIIVFYQKIHKSTQNAISFNKDAHAHIIYSRTQYVYAREWIKHACFEPLKQKWTSTDVHFVEKSDELSDRFFQDLQPIEDFLKPSPDSILYP